MRPFFFLLTVASFYFLQGCSSSKKATTETNNTNKVVSHKSKNNIPPVNINTKNVLPDSIVAFAETLIGTRYKYGSAKKEQGFDCSGFITYVFNHFNIQVPRTSVSFTNAGKMVELEDCKKGDLILFTGTDTTGWIVGHMGIITQNKKGKLLFIHSASGNSKGVMISGMNDYFSSRFVKVIRIFN